MKPFLIFWFDPTGDQDEIGFVEANSEEEGWKTLGVIPPAKKDDPVVVEGIAISLLPLEEVKDNATLRQKCRDVKMIWDLSPARSKK